MSGPVAHAELGASSAHRWMNCPGSVRMQRGIPNVDTDYTREGTAAHALLEQCLRSGLDAGSYVGLHANGEPLTEEMAEAVQVAVEEVRRLMALDPASELSIERRFSLASLHPPAPMFGTSDVVILQPTRKRLIVLDYKHGAGYAVAGKGNPQLKYYALGAAVHYEGAGRRPFTEVEILVVQPRAGHPDGPVRGEVIPAQELADFAGDLLAMADAAVAPDAPLRAGEWCRFCRAQAVCPAKMQEAQALAQLEFSQAASQAPPAPETLTEDQIRAVLEYAPLLESWIKAVKDYVLNEALAGRPVAGWKVVPKRATRKWRDEQEVRDWLGKAGVPPEEYETRELKSVAQLEKVVGKKNFPEMLVIKESSGVTLAPDHDPRQAVQPGTEFEALPLALD